MSKPNRTRIRWSGDMDFDEAERLIDQHDRSNRSTLPRKAKRQLLLAYAEVQDERR
jgi:hypothetical protein